MIQTNLKKQPLNTLARKQDGLEPSADGFLPLTSLENWRRAPHLSIGEKKKMTFFFLSIPQGTGAVFLASRIGSAHPVKLLDKWRALSASG